jgi:glutathione synthase/RimK-type ligase-like ATP-grasp enzyme
MKKANTPLRVRDVALKACRVVGKGLYGVDIKEVNGEFVVVEVNDNPSIYAGYEDLRDKDLYSKVITYLTE